ncbi:MAG: DUF2974 domain-containing protein [Oscillospiraceae bacterium]|jgi:hypothetical protein|nr:DUF2974 domain-containing protein [Oscillospiraceae bacterium]
MKLSVFQIEQLCAVVYLDVLISELGKNNLAYIMTHMLENGFAEIKELPAFMTREEWETVARNVVNDSELGGLAVFDYVNDEHTGHRAFCFLRENEGYVVFRGTSSDAEWIDNGIGMTEAETPAQKAALDFIVRVRAIPGVSFICAAGHSKGGNKAQYCAVKGAGIVDRCVSVNGQGFSRLFFDKYSDIIEKAKFKITSVAERRDFVNCLGFYLKEPLFYSGGRGSQSEQFPHGNPLPYFHCPDALWLRTGEQGESAPVSYISGVINNFVAFFLTDKKYEKKREKTALGLVSLMTENGEDKESTDAIAEAALAFFELTAKSEDFRAKLRDLLLNEKELIAATTLMVRQNHMNSGIIADMAMRRTAEKLLIHPVYFNYFIRSAEKFVVFTHKNREAKEHTEYVNHFLKNIFRHVERRGDYKS